MHVGRSLILPFMAMILTCTGCAFVSMDLGNLTRMQPFEERVIHDGSGDKVLVVEILGLIRTTDRHDAFMPRQGTFERLENILDKAKKDKNIKAVILKIDSPGGGYTASD
ncbi:hypothetical protein EG833_02260, partial [archaeon]|nr:hypothetical protein [archaeon]